MSVDSNPNAEQIAAYHKRILILDFLYHDEKCLMAGLHAIRARSRGQICTCNVYAAVKVLDSMCERGGVLVNHLLTN